MNNVQRIGLCLENLRLLLIARMKPFKGEAFDADIETLGSGLSELFIPHLKRDKLDAQECLLLGIALFPHIRPQLFDRIIQEMFPAGGSFPELGGLRGNDYRGFVPTGLTALYLLAGDDLAQRFHIQSLLSSGSFLIKSRALRLMPTEKSAPALSGALVLDPELVEMITVGTVSRPAFSTEFPAAHVSTELDWKDLVLPDTTREQIVDIHVWLEHHRVFLYEWNLAHKFKPGYRALFHGPPGTGKTLTAMLLGKYVSMDVYKVDLSTVVSKYIGETEKNLSNLFDRAEHKKWILFFDEADALFGKRTMVQNAHDKYANQEVSYLLQRIENYNGLVILASNFKNNIDDAFLRRFQSIVHFPTPTPKERLNLWEHAIPPQITLNEDVNLKYIAQKYDLTGADIVNIVQSVCLNAIAKKQHCISLESITTSIKQEMIKSNMLI